MTSREQAAQARAAAVAAPADRPSVRRFQEDDTPTSRARVVLLDERSAVPVTYGERDGLQVASFSRYASITDTPYEMWDSFGPYVETVAREAFPRTLASAPLVEFSANHGRSLPMAHTRNGTLDLALDERGLVYTPHVDPTRSDVADMLKAVERGDMPESSFKFRIVRGQWSPDFTEYRIEEVDLHRGDVSIVNFGANPFTGDFSPREAAAPAVVRAPRNTEYLKARLSLALAE